MAQTPRSRTATGAARREALLDAALVCFEAKGLVRTGIEDIREEAGASPSSVYHLFGGLPDIIGALLERTFVRRFESVTARVVRTRTARTAVIALVEAHLDWVIEHPTEARFMYRALALDLDGGRIEELFATKEELKRALNEHLERVGVLSPGTPPAMVDVVVLGVTHQACRVWLTAPEVLDPAWMRRTLPGLAWRTVRPEAAPR